MKYQSKIILDNENTLKNAKQITKRFYKVSILSLLAIFVFYSYIISIVLNLFNVVHKKK